MLSSIPKNAILLEATGTIHKSYFVPDTDTIIHTNRFNIVQLRQPVDIPNYATTIQDKLDFVVSHHGYADPGDLTLYETSFCVYRDTRNAFYVQVSMPYWIQHFTIDFSHPEYNDQFETNRVNSRDTLQQHFNRARKIAKLYSSRVLHAPCREIKNLPSFK